MDEAIRIPTRTNTVFHTAASLSLFLPFLVLFVMFFALRQETGILGAAILAISGIGSAIVALCGIPRYGTAGIFGSAITGLLINATIAIIAIPGFLHSRAEQIKSRQRQMAIGRASVAVWGQIEEPKIDFKTLTKKLRNAQLLDFTNVTNKSQLVERKQPALEFIGADEQVKALGAKEDALFQVELAKQGLSRADIDSIMSGGNRSGSILSEAIRDQDLIMAKDMLDLFGLMEEQWGTWRIAPGQPGILFEKDSDRKSYLDLCRKIDRAREGQRDLQKRLDKRL